MVHLTARWYGRLDRIGAGLMDGARPRSRLPLAWDRLTRDASVGAGIR